MPRYSHIDLDKLFQFFCHKLICDQIRQTINGLPSELCKNLPVGFSADLSTAILRKLFGKRVLRRPYGFDGTEQVIATPGRSSQLETLSVESDAAINADVGMTVRAAQPSVGRIVHYTDRTDRPPIAGIITAVSGPTDEGRVCLHLFDRGVRATIERSAVPFSETPKPQHWSWPPRT